MFFKPINQVVSTTIRPDGTFSVATAPEIVFLNPVPSLLVFLLIFFALAFAPLSFVEHGQDASAGRQPITTLQTAPSASMARQKGATAEAAAPYKGASMNATLFPLTGSSSSSGARSSASSGIRLLPQSTTRILTEEEILIAIERSQIPHDEFLRLAAIEILAANGDTLADKEPYTQKHFNDQEWYRAIPDKHIVEPEELTDIEALNIILLRDLLV